MTLGETCDHIQGSLRQVRSCKVKKFDFSSTVRYAVLDVLNFDTEVAFSVHISPLFAKEPRQQLLMHQNPLQEVGYMWAVCQKWSEHVDSDDRVRPTDVTWRHCLLV